MITCINFIETLLYKEQLLMYFSSMIQDQFSHNIKTNIKFHNTSRILIENDDENYICMSYDYIIKLKCIEKKHREEN